MALSDIIDAIRVETDAAVSAIEQTSLAQVAAVTEEGARAAARAESELATARSIEEATVSDRILNRARLDAERALRAVRDEIVQQLFADVQERLAHLRETAGYSSVLAQLTHEAEQVLPDAVEIHVDPRDRLMTLDLTGDRLRCVPDLTTWGGVVMTNPDGRTVRNTLELRFKRAAPHLRKLAAELVPELGAGLP